VSKPLINIDQFKISSELGNGKKKTHSTPRGLANSDPGVVVAGSSNAHLP